MSPGQAHVRYPVLGDYRVALPAALRDTTDGKGSSTHNQEVFMKAARKSHVDMGEERVASQNRVREVARSNGELTHATQGPFSA